ncbi:translation machinery-associated protein 16 homolog [Pectinophora gossypiella]|uniref:translation machinery-associated protein 16 homolog n=1 Tax=Pectinophora gossypiella TaxID=13191 RepID=UPI00214EE2C3|nr:translation machinery-associated protein 16 homolog [Pectinophora gossypiella]
MPKIKKSLDNLKHPNSRKTLSLAKKMKRNERKEQNKLGTHIKQNLTGEKILWFKERIPEGCSVLATEQVLELINTYLARFDEELEQIQLKNSVGHRKNRQHASREDVINITKKRELEEFDTCGIEMPDLMDAQQMEVLKTWNGELRYLQHFKLRRFSKKHLI